jgi:hypothetical protein
VRSQSILTYSPTYNLKLLTNDLNIHCQVNNENNCVLLQAIKKGKQDL